MEWPTVSKCERTSIQRLQTHCKPAMFQLNISFEDVCFGKSSKKILISQKYFMNMNLSRYDDTIVAPATIPGTGAITIIRMSGSRTFELLDAVVSFKNGSAAEAKPYTIKYGNILDSDGSVLDEVLVSFFKAPHSYTGEDSAEISCHASSCIASEILRLLCDAGARMAEPGEFTRRAFVNGKMDLSQAEAVADVISSNSTAALHLAMNQLRGNYSSKLKELRDKLLEMSSLLELELDFSEEDVEFADRSKLAALLDDVLAHVRRLKESFKYGNEIKNGIPVAIVGRVNAGKSTLLNALAGEERAIVTDIPGTTRDTLEDTVTIDGILFRFIDTAGLRSTEDPVEKIGVSKSYEKLEKASIVLAVIDVTATEEENTASITDIATKLDTANQKLIVLFNKIDKLAPNINVSILNNSVSLTKNKTDIIYISAKTGFGLDELKKRLAATEKDKTFNSDDAIVTNSRHWSALNEAEKYLQHLKDSMASGVSNDLLAEDLRQANQALGTITGEVTTDELLGNIFSHFCIGK
jgi:tRNA modification GTPase